MLENCAHDRRSESIQTFKNGSTHIRIDCADCGKFIKYESQNKPFVFHFGKHKGKNIKQVLIDGDWEYLDWCMGNLDKRTADKIKAEIG